ncbi:hypothetical protein KIPB_010518, partial [Kipferlia bialata]|eukprot:g10518.t1
MSEYRPDVPEGMRLMYTYVDVMYIPTRNHSTSTLIGTGQILVIGAARDGECRCAIVTVLPDGGVKAQPIECPSSPRLYHHSATRIGEDVFVSGGTVKMVDGEVHVKREGSRVMWRFHIPDRSWQQHEGLREPLFGHVTADVDGHLFVAGGFRRKRLSRCTLYDPSSGSWASKPDAPASLYCAGSVVVDGVLHCFGGCVSTGEYSKQHLSCDLRDFSWTHHPDMPFCCIYPLVWSVHPYIVVGGGLVGNSGGVYALHLESGQWKDWGLFPIGVVRASCCALSEASAYIQSSKGSYIVTSETVLERERVASFDAHVSDAARCQITAEIERLAPRVEGALQRLCAVIPAPSTAMVEGGRGGLQGWVDALEPIGTAAHALSVSFLEGDIPPAEEIVSLTAQLSEHNHSSLASDLGRIHTFLGVAESVAAHVATLQLFVKGMAEGRHMSLDTDLAGLHASLTETAEAHATECGYLFDGPSLQEVVAACLSQLSSAYSCVGACMAKCADYSSLPLPHSVESLSEPQATRYMEVLGHNGRVCALVIEAQRLRGITAAVPDTISRLQELRLPSKEVCAEVRRDTTSALSVLYSRIQEAADARSLMEQISSIETVSEGRVCELKVERDISVARLTHMSYTPSDRANAISKRDSIAHELDEARAALAERRRLCELLKRHTKFTEVAE